MPKKRGIARGDKIECPYCGREGEVIDIFKCGKMFVIHEIGTREVAGKVSGKNINLVSVVDACNDGKLMGSRYE